MEKDVGEVAFLVGTARESAHSIWIVIGPMPGQAVSPVAARQHSSSYNCFGDLIWTVGTGPDWMGRVKGHKCWFKVQERVEMGCFSSELLLVVIKNSGLAYGLPFGF